MSRSKHRRTDRKPDRQSEKSLKTKALDELVRVVFDGSITVSGEEIWEVQDIFKAYFLGIREFAPLGPTRIRQGVPLAWQENEAIAFRKSWNLDNGTGFELKTRTREEDERFLLVRFGRLMMRGDLGPFDRTACRLEAAGGLEAWWEGLRNPIAEQEASEALKLFQRYQPEDSLLASLAEDLTIVPLTDGSGRVAVHYTVTSVPPPMLAMEGLNSTLYTPDPWAMVLSLVDPDDRWGRRTTAFFLENDQRLGSLKGCFESGGPAIVLQLGGSVPTQEHGKVLIDKIQAAIPGLVSAFVLGPEVDPAAVAAVLKPSAPKGMEDRGMVIPGGILVVPSPAQRKAGARLDRVVLKLGDLQDPMLIESIISVASNCFQFAQHPNDLERFDTLIASKQAMDAVMETLEAEIVNRVNEAKSETQKVQRELQIARGQIQDLQAENRRLGNAHGRDKEAGIVRVRELEGRLATADAELASLRQVVEDLKTRSEMSERILEEAGGQPVGAFHRMQEASDALRRDLETVQAERTALSQEVARLRGEVSTLRRRLHDAGRQIESLGGMTNNVRNESGEDVLRRERTLAVLAGAPSLEQGLLFLQENFGDRLTVLNSALASARQADSDGFLYAPRAFDMMKALVTEYWEALVAGHGDTKAKDIFGRDGYASRESDTGEGNERMRRDRTFVWKGTPIYMGKHLRIGVKADLKETWRLHFHWDPSERRIVIGHCGHHLWKLGF